MSIEAMKQWLEALEGCRIEYDYHGNPMDISDINVLNAITALRQAIEQQEKQEPVAWQVHPFDYGFGYEGVYARTDRTELVESWKRKGWTVHPLYTTPQPQQEPVGINGLTETQTNATASVFGLLNTSQPKREQVMFPTMLRKMWSGGEVQAWLDENVNKEKNT